MYRCRNSRITTGATTFPFFFSWVVHNHNRLPNTLATPCCRNIGPFLLTFLPPLDSGAALFTRRVGRCVGARVRAGVPGGQVRLRDARPSIPVRTPKGHQSAGDREQFFLFFFFPRYLFLDFVGIIFSTIFGSIFKAMFWIHVLDPCFGSAFGSTLGSIFAFSFAFLEFHFCFFGVIVRFGSVISFDTFFSCWLCRKGKSLLCP